MRKFTLSVTLLTILPLLNNSGNLNARPILNKLFRRLPEVEVLTTINDKDRLPYRVQGRINEIAALPILHLTIKNNSEIDRTVGLRFRLTPTFADPIFNSSDLFYTTTQVYAAGTAAELLSPTAVQLNTRNDPATPQDDRDGWYDLQICVTSYTDRNLAYDCKTRLVNLFRVDLRVDSLEVADRIPFFVQGDDPNEPGFNSAVIRWPTFYVSNHSSFNSIALAKVYLIPTFAPTSFVSSVTVASNQVFTADGTSTKWNSTALVPLRTVDDMTTTQDEREGTYYLQVCILDPETKIVNDCQRRTVSLYRYQKQLLGPFVRVLK